MLEINKRVFKVILPSILILAFIIFDYINLSYSKYILVGLYGVFPIIFIIQGAIYIRFKRELVLGFLLSSISVLLCDILYDILYNMGTELPFVLIYIVLGIITFNITKKCSYKKVA